MQLKQSYCGESAVEFRTPKPVAEILLLEHGDSYPVCPRCSISLDREYMNFCDRCGQRLDWKQFKKAQIIYPKHSPTYL